MGTTPPTKADGSIICPSTPAFLHPNIHLSIQTLTAPDSVENITGGESQGHVSVKRKRSTGRLCEQMCAHIRLMAARSKPPELFALKLEGYLSTRQQAARLRARAQSGRALRG